MELQILSGERSRSRSSFKVRGLISALTACLCDVGARQDTDVERGTLAVSLALVTLCQNIIDKMLSIMAGVAGQEACPSFAEIGEALENILLEGSGDYTEGTALSSEYQYMLSWCWNNIKESCTSLGEITQKLVTRTTELPPSFIPSIKSTFLAVLTKCRHKGVIEGCRGAFVTFCSALFSSSDESVYSIPAGILREVLLSLKQKSILSSVTRRSAGLPIIVQAIIVSEKQTKKNILLCEALLGLFDLCKLPLDIDPGVTDLPQVHGINMLNTLFSEASLSGSLIGHTGHVTIMVVRLFGSPSWAVRNAATRLFSTLVTKLFGQKKSQENKLCNSVTYKEFSAYYPELPPFLLEVLKEASERDLQNICTIHPCLFPVLTLLSSLNPMDSQDGNLKEEMDVYRNLIKRFTASPVYQLRHLVAQALVAMVTREDMKSSLMSCLEVSISYSVNDVNVNSIHGDLLFVQKVLEYIASATSVHAVWQELVGKAWLLNSTNGIVSGLYLQILTTLLKCLQDVDVPAHLVEAVSKICLQDKKIIGDSVVCQAGVHFLLAASVHSGKSTCTLIGQLMSADNLETRKACLQFLCDSLDELDIDDPYEIIVS
ncbi:hypothetical protein DPMN_090247 [Dreissena polymorpha]|uniref:DUF2428 domain-containing protein n=1 Tax=Dreissena polymorpha TaxID=45954 RepID=A0A9D4KXD4_DREPO|nr:hypothetical protein DPMN_090247 [Dreissena polymorpha]